MAQGTIQEFDDDSRQGQLLLDDRSEVRIDATSLQGSGVRSLRLGQRVKFDVVAIRVFPNGTLDRLAHVCNVFP